MLALYLNGPEGNPLDGRRVLHISPESILAPFAKAAQSYETSDPELPGMNHRFDATAMDTPDGSYDAIICNHVLEHVEDDRAALGEFYRVLAPGGIAIITIPIIEGWAVTYEDASLNTPELRARHFGQHDHVRYYGRDFRDRVRAVGFALDEFQPTPQQCAAHAVTRGQCVFVGRRPEA